MFIKVQETVTLSWPLAVLRGSPPTSILRSGTMGRGRLDGTEIASVICEHMTDFLHRGASSLNQKVVGKAENPSSLAFDTPAGPL